MNDNIEIFKPRKKLKTTLKASPKDLKKDWIALSIRVPSEMLSDIDHFTYKQIGMSRTCWILQAIQEKIKKEVLGE